MRWHTGCGREVSAPPCDTALALSQATLAARGAEAGKRSLDRWKCVKESSIGHLWSTDVGVMCVPSAACELLAGEAWLK